MMGKNLLKILLGLIAACTAIAGLLWFEKENAGEYVEIYSDNDSLF